MRDVVSNVIDLRRASAFTVHRRRRSAYRSGTMVGAALPLACLLLGAVSPATAHGIYGGLTSRSGKDCCQEGDCAPANYRFVGRHLEMQVGGRWIHVPQGAIQHRAIDGDDGATKGGHWCGEVYEGSHITYCAFLPPELAAIR